MADACATEDRIFLDVPWQTVSALVKFAQECFGETCVRDSINNLCKAEELSQVSGRELPSSFDSPAFRRVIGKAAKNKNNPWFKDPTRGGRLAEIIAPCLDQISDKPLAITITSLRQWVDA